MGTLQTMLRWLQHLILNLRVYPVMRPDFHQRCQVNQQLKARSALSELEWHDRFSPAKAIPQEITNFVYRHLPHYSGLTFDRVLPNDCLEKDLHLTLVCWFDWQGQLCEDFWQVFQVDISDRLDWSSLNTVEDFVLFLSHQLQATSTPAVWPDQSGQ